MTRLYKSVESNEYDSCNGDIEKNRVADVHTTSRPPSMSLRFRRSYHGCKKSCYRSLPAGARRRPWCCEEVDEECLQIDTKKDAFDMDQANSIDHSTSQRIVIMHERC
jgi:hypothetical protein